MRKLTPLLLILATAIVVMAAQQINSWTVGNFTVNVPLANPAVTVQSPARSGTMALREDIVAGPVTQAPEAKGVITLVNGVGSAVLSGFTVPPTICIPYDPSGNSVKVITKTATLLTVSGVGPTATVEYFCK